MDGAADFWDSNGAMAAGFYGDPFNSADLFNTFDGATSVVTVGDLIGRFARQAGSFDWLQPNSVARAQWAQHPYSGITQLLQYPQAVQNAVWTKTNVTPLDGQASWDGSLTATLLTVGTANNSGVSQAPLTLSATAIIALKVKKGTAGWLRLFTPNATNGNVWYDLTNRGFGTVQANILANGKTDAGNGYDLVWAASAGVNNFGIRIEDTNGVSGSPTAGQTILMADPIFALGTAVPTFQNATGPFDIRQDGQPSVYLPRHTGSSFFEGPAAFGLATSGLFATAGQSWHLIEIERTLATGTTTGQCGTTAASQMFRSYTASDGTRRTIIRGTDNNSGVITADGLFHIIHTDCSNGVVTRRIDAGARSALTVGAAAAEAQVITSGCHNQAAPAGYLTGRALSLMSDATWTADKELSFNAWAKRRYGLPI
jgi:hypothetical protein